MQTLWQAVGPEATDLIRLGNDINRLGERTSPSVGRRPSAVQSVPPQYSTVHGGCSVSRGTAEQESGGRGGFPTTSMAACLQGTYRTGVVTLAITIGLDRLI